MIPKIIHYCWFGGAPIDEATQKYIKTWEKFCPDYEIKRWDEESFDINSNLYAKQAYEAKKWAFVTDYVRLWALNTFGGVYMDTDVELTANIDDFLSHTAFSGFEDEEHIPTAIMASQANGEWIGYLLSYYDERPFILKNGEYDLTTNVKTITDMTVRRYKIELNNTKQDIDGVFTLYPNDYFCPKSHKTGEINCTNNTRAIHHFSASWQDGDVAYFRKIRKRCEDIFGKKTGAKIYYLIRLSREERGLIPAIIKILSGKIKRHNETH